jgi:hypothetical protein
MKVTREFIMAHRTERGAWTYAQIETSGLKWPPLKGWIDSVIGQELTDAQVAKFKDNNVPHKRQASSNPDQLGLF